MVGISSMNLIDVNAIVSNIMLVDSMRASRLVEQRSVQDAQITAYQALNTSLLQVSGAAQAITSSSSWVPASVSVSYANPADAGTVSASVTSGAVSGASPYAFTVTSIVDAGTGSTTATIEYDKNGVTKTATSTSNTFTNLADFPGLTITVTGTTTDTVTLTPSATTVTDASVMKSAASSLVSGLNATLALIASQTSATGALSSDYTPREVSQKLLNTAWDTNTLASLADAGIELTRYGTFTYNEAKLAAALAAGGSTAAKVIGQVAAFADRVDTVATAATSVTGVISRQISTRQTRVSDLNDRITDMAANMARREEALTIYYAEINAKIQTLQNQQTYLQTQLDVFTKALTKS